MTCATFGVAEVEGPVDGDRVVQGGEDGPAVVEQAADAPPQALVVVDQVEVGPPAGEEAAGAKAEGQRLGKGSRRHERHLEQVDPAAVGPRVQRRPEGVVGVVEVEARHRDEAHPLGQLRPGLPGEDGSQERLLLGTDKQQGTGG